MDEQDLLRRAFSAYFRTAKNSGESLQQPSSDSAVCATADGRHYVVLRSVSGILAVYRVRTPDGTLKRLKRWPAELVSY